VIEEASASCGDGVSLSILHLGIAYKLGSNDSKNLHTLSELLIRGSWALDQLGMIARNKIQNLPDFDEAIEVYLGYPIMLKARLRLQIDVEEMFFFKFSQLTNEDLTAAETFILNQMNQEDFRYHVLLKYPEWQKALSKSYPKEFEEIQAQKDAEIQKTIEENTTNYEAIQEKFEEQIKALSKKALERPQADSEAPGPDRLNRQLRRNERQSRPY